MPLVENKQLFFCCANFFPAVPLRPCFGTVSNQRDEKDRFVRRRLIIPNTENDISDCNDSDDDNRHLHHEFYRYSCYCYYHY